MSKAAELQQVMERRVHRWLSMPFPYGSELAWDKGHAVNSVYSHS